MSRFRVCRLLNRVFAEQEISSKKALSAKIGEKFEPLDFFEIRVSRKLGSQKSAVGGVPTSGREKVRMLLCDFLEVSGGVRAPGHLRWDTSSTP